MEKDQLETPIKKERILFKNSCNQVVKKLIITSTASLLLLLSMTLIAMAADVDKRVKALQDLGEYVFWDKISNPPRQACVTCHQPDMGWTGGVSGINKKGVAIPGANPHTVGNRKPPSNAYSSFKPPFNTPSLSPFIPGISPSLCFDTITPPFPVPVPFGPLCFGGAFWDGRATGKKDPGTPGAMPHVGDEVFDTNEQKNLYKDFIGPVADQALGPFPNDVEQNVPDGNDNGLPGAEAVCRHVQSQKYAELYEIAWGEKIECNEAPDISFKRIALAISAWQHSDEVNSFSSKRDIALVNDDDGAFPLVHFTDEENLGHDLFYGLESDLNPSGKNANCALCHNNKGFGSRGEELDQVYMDFAYHNLGLPPNYEIKNYDPNISDQGLSQHTDPGTAPGVSPLSMHYATATLRNVAKKRGVGVTKAFMHNGYFKTLEQVVHFYNTAAEDSKNDPKKCPPGTTAAQAMARDCWPAPERTVGTEARGVGPGALFGRLGLTPDEEAALVAYMETLTDTKTPKKPNPYKPTKR
jgi:cytochrome c peroxidase